MLVIVALLVLASLIALIGKRSQRDAVEAAQPEPQYNSDSLKLAVFDSLYHIVLIRHENGEEYLEIRDKRHHVMGISSDGYTFEPLNQQQQQKKGA